MKTNDRIRREELEAKSRRMNFAQEYVENGHDKTAAARFVGIPANEAETAAEAMLSHYEVKTYIDQFDKSLKNRYKHTKEMNIDELEQARMLALKTKDVKALIQIADRKAKLFGLDAPTQVKTDTTHSGEVSCLHKIDLEERLKQIILEKET